MYVNLHETYLLLIRDIKAYSHSDICSKCEPSLWKYPAWLGRHEMTCEAGCFHVYSGGVYHNTPSLFQRLDDEGITDGSRTTVYAQIHDQPEVVYKKGDVLGRQSVELCLVA